MSDQSPYTTLGVTEDASFDEIKDARHRLMQEHGDDQQQLQSIEAAYDAILMDRLRLRREGRIKVPDGIRFPEKPTQPIVEFSTSAANEGSSWLRGFLDTPTQADILYPGGILLALSLGVILMPYGQGAGVQLALATATFTSLYFLRRKENRFGRAMLLTLGGLLLGLTLGSVFVYFAHSLLIYVPLVPQVIVSLITFLVFWLFSSFLR